MGRRDESSVERVSRCGVVPVVVLPDAASAVPLARALAAGGIDVIEITLRNEIGLSGLEAVAREVPEVLPVAGTVVTPHQARQVRDAGALLAVSPGFSEALDEECRTLDLPWLPGVATASDCLRATAAGRDVCKFFPAEQAGGIEMLKALGGPFPKMRFCPTGGVGLSNLGAYLGLPAVIAVGGSWLAPQALIASGDWNRITELARQARNAVESARSAD